MMKRNEETTYSSNELIGDMFIDDLKVITDDPIPPRGKFHRLQEFVENMKVGQAVDVSKMVAGILPSIMRKQGYKAVQRMKGEDLVRVWKAKDNEGRRLARRARNG